VNRAVGHGEGFGRRFSARARRLSASGSETSRRTRGRVSKGRAANAWTWWYSS